MSCLIVRSKSTSTITKVDFSNENGMFYCIQQSIHFCRLLKTFYAFYEIAAATVKHTTFEKLEYCTAMPLAQLGVPMTKKF